MSNCSGRMFPGNDAEYLEWVRANPKSFVLNRTRAGAKGYNVIHRATCDSVTQLKGLARSGGFTERNYIKVGAPDIASLEHHARRINPDAVITRCGKCSPM